MRIKQSLKAFREPAEKNDAVGNGIRPQRSSRLRLRSGNNSNYAAIVETVTFAEKRALLKIIEIHGMYPRKKKI